MPPLPAYDHALTGDAVICEVRRLRRLPHVIANVRVQLSAAWTVHLLHSADSDRDVRAFAPLQPALASGALKLRPLALPASTDFSTRAWYNEYVLTHEFWASFGAPLLLMFEADSALCPSPTRPLLSFADFAYVGATWAPDPSAYRPSWCKNLARCVGNSGLSLWRRETLANVTRRRPHEYLPLVSEFLGHERGPVARRGTGSDRVQFNLELANRSGWRPVRHVDVWVTRMLQALEAAGRLPPPARLAVPSDHEASRFSVETFFPRGDYTPIGVHKAYRYLPAAQHSKLLERCPTARLLVNESLDGVVGEPPKAAAKPAKGGKAQGSKRARKAATSTT